MGRGLAHVGRPAESSPWGAGFAMRESSRLE